MQFCLSKLALFRVLFFPGKQDGKKKSLDFFFFFFLDYLNIPPILSSQVM